MADEAIAPRPIVWRATWAVTLLLVGVLLGVLAVHESLYFAASDLVRVSPDGSVLPNHAAGYGWAAAAAFLTGSALLIAVVFALGAAWDASVGAVARPGIFDPSPDSGVGAARHDPADGDPPVEGVPESAPPAGESTARGAGATP